MAQYMFLLFDDESWYDHVDDDAFAEEMKLHHAFSEAVAAAGARVLGGEALERSSTATVVRRDPDRADSTPLLSDGPFIETKEALGGFYVIEAGDLDQALELAAHCPSTVIEVRPVMVIPEELPTDNAVAGD
ncbi:MAG: YciI family protein [Ilumatobacteraceae bacterium]